MSLLTALRPKRVAAPAPSRARCAPACETLDEAAHTRRHLVEDFEIASAEARRQRRPVTMRFAIFEQQCDASLHDEVLRCSRRDSSVRLISSADVAHTMEAIRGLITNECKDKGVHLSELRDIYTERSRTAYIIYEIRVEPGFQPPPK